MSQHEIRSVKTLYEGWGKLLLAEIRLPDGGTIKREIEDHGQAVAVLPYDPVRRVAMLLRQFRAPAFLAAGHDAMLEVPAGVLDEDDPEDCARREAFEEVGLRLGELEPLGIGWAMPGISTEHMHLFLAPYGEADRTGRGGGLEAEQENITPEEIGLDELGRMAGEGRIPDMKTHLLALMLRARHPELFA